MGKSSYPITNIQELPADIVVAFGDRHDLMVGQVYIGAGSAVSGNLYQDVQALSNSEINSLFGIDTELTNRINDYLTASGRQVKLSVIPIEDAQEAPIGSSIGQIEFFGVVTKAGLITVSLVDEYKYTIELPVAIDDTAQSIAAGITTSLSNLLACPVSVSYVGGLTTFTAKNSGTIGDTYGLKVVPTDVEGISIFLDGFSGGGINPTLTGILDVLGEMRVTGIGWPEAWDSTPELAELIDFLEARFTALNAITDGVGFLGHSGTYADNKAFAQSYNTHVLVIGGNNYQISDGSQEKITIYSLTRILDVTTVVAVEDHNLETGDIVRIEGAVAPPPLTTSFNGTFAIIVTTVKEFTYANPGTDEGAVSHGTYRAPNILNETFEVGPVIFKPADYTMAVFMAIRSKRLSEGALISGDIVARNGILDNVGGSSLASLPYFNTVDKRSKVPADISATYSQLEEFDLVEAGFTVFGVNSAGTGIIFRAVVTTYKTDSAGNPNDSFKFLNFVDTGSVCREILFNNVKARFAQTRLTTGKLIPGRNIANAASIKVHYLDILNFLGDQALLEAGSDSQLEMSQATTVSIDTVNRSASVFGPIILVTQLGEITYSLQFQFATQTA